jgi:CHAT domain-containing protein/tetratricopeptide (TPR) repeat protein
MFSNTFISAEETDKRDVAYNLFEEGKDAFVLKDYQIAEKYFNDSLVIYRKIGDKQSETDIMTWIAKLNLGRDNLIESIKNLKEAQNIYSVLKSKPSEKACVTDIDKAVQALEVYAHGVEELKTQNYETAIVKFKETLQVVREIKGEKESVINLLTLIGTLYQRINKDDEAIKYFNEVKRCYQEAQNYFVEGLKLLQTGQAEDAITLFLEVISVMPDFADVYQNMGMAYISLGKFNDAIRNLKISINLYKKQENKSGAIYFSYLALGKSYFESREDLKAIYAYQEALKLKPDFLDKQETAEILFIIGNIYDEYLLKPENALEYYNKALLLYTDSKNIIKTSLVQGYVYIASGLEIVKKQNKNLSEAKEYCLKAIKISEDIKDKNLSNRANLQLIIIYQTMGDNKSALMHLETLLQFYRESNNKEMESSCLQLGAMNYIALGNYTKALDYFQEALKIVEETTNLREKSKILAGIGKLFYFEGDYQKSTEYLGKALSIAERNNYKEEEADIYQGLGTLYRYLGDDEKALEYYLLSLKVLTEIEQEEGIENDKGFIHAEIARSYERIWFSKLAYSSPFEEKTNSLWAKSTEHYGKAISEYQRIGNKLEEGRMYSESAKDFAVFSKGAENQSQVIELLNKAFNLHKQIGSKLYEMEDYFTAGEIYEMWGNHSSALQNFNKGLEISRSLNGMGWDHKFLDRIGVVYTNLGDYDKAFSLYKEALSINQDRGLYHHSLIILSNIGWNFRLAGKYEDAKKYYSNAIEIMELTRTALHAEDSRMSFSGDIEKFYIYEGMIYVLLKLGENGKAFNYAEHAKSRVLLDSLGNKLKLNNLKDNKLIEDEKKLRERMLNVARRIDEEMSSQKSNKQGTILHDLKMELTSIKDEYIQLITKIMNENPELSTLISINPIPLEEVQNLLDTDTTLLEYFITPDKTLLWVVGKSDLKVIEIALKDRELTKKVNTYREKITTLQLDHEKNSRELYDLLIKPAKPYIKTKRVDIVPHAILHYLPFQALLGENGKYFIEEYDLFFTPSASVLKFVYEKRKKITGKVLAFGNPDVGDEKLNLPYAETEIKKIKENYPETSFYLKKTATEEKVKKLSSDYNIVHFASHGELNPEAPLFSSIRLAKDKEEDGRLEVHEIFNLDLKNTSLVTLSACETGLGKLTQGDELIGLTRGFIYAGTPSILASLWKVNDSSTAEFMSMFYKNLKKYPKSEALRMAQIEMIHGDVGKGIVRGVGGITTSKEGRPSQQSSLTVDGSHPYFWAPFILIGDWK